MGVPISQMWTVASYVIGQKLRRRRRYPLVLMLEPLFRCNLLRFRRNSASFNDDGLSTTLLVLRYQDIS